MNETKHLCRNCSSLTTFSITYKYILHCCKSISISSVSTLSCLSLRLFLAAAHGKTLGTGEILLRKSACHNCMLRTYQMVWGARDSLGVAPAGDVSYAASSTRRRPGSITRFVASVPRQGAAQLKNVRALSQLCSLRMGLVAHSFDVNCFHTFIAAVPLSRKSFNAVYT